MTEVYRDAASEIVSGRCHNCRYAYGVGPFFAENACGIGHTYSNSENAEKDIPCGNPPGWLKLDANLYRNISTREKIMIPREASVNPNGECREWQPYPPEAPSWLAGWWGRLFGRSKT